MQLAVNNYWMEIAPQNNTVTNSKKAMEEEVNASADIPLIGLSLMLLLTSPINTQALHQFLHLCEVLIQLNNGKNMSLLLSTIEPQHAHYYYYQPLLS